MPLALLAHGTESTVTRVVQDAFNKMQLSRHLLQLIFQDVALFQNTEVL